MMRKPADGPSAFSCRCCILLAATLALCLVSCAEDKPVPLEELAAQAGQDTPAPPSAGPVLPLIQMEVSRPDRLQALLAGPASMAGTLLGLTAVEVGKQMPPMGQRLRLDVISATLDVDPETGRFFFSPFRALVWIACDKEGAPDVVARTWQAALASLPGPDEKNHPVSCVAKAHRVRCSVGEPDPAFEAIEAWSQSRWLEQQTGATGSLNFSLDIRQCLAMADQAVGAALLWGFLPEDARNLRLLTLAYGEKDDRLVVELTGASTRLMQGLDALLAPPRQVPTLPNGLPFVAYASLQEAASGSERLDDIWKMRGLGSLLDLSKLLNENWKHQLLDLVSGIAGITAVAPISLDSPADSLIYILQPSEPEMLEKRLEYVFSSKHFTIERKTTDAGKTIVVALRKMRGGKGKEYLTWMQHDSTFFVAETSSQLETIAKGLEGAGGDGLQSQVLGLKPGQRFVGRVDVAGLAGALQAQKKAGLAMRLALGMVSKTAESVKDPITLSVYLDLSGAPESQVLRFEATNVGRTLGVLSEKLGPFLSLAQE